MILIHEKLFELSTIKKQLIIQNKVDELSKMLIQEARCMRLVEEEDNRRIDAITRFLFEKGIQMRGKMAVSELAKLVNDRNDKAKLLQEVERLNQVVKKLKDINALNQLLIQQSLQFISCGFDLFLGEPAQEATYRRPAPSAYDIQRKAVMDRRF